MLSCTQEATLSLKLMKNHVNEWQVSWLPLEAGPRAEVKCTFALNVVYTLS